MIFFLMLFLSAVSINSINGIIDFEKAPLLTNLEEAGKLILQTKSMTDDLVKLVQQQIDIQSVLIQEFDFYSTNYSSVNKMTLEAGQAEELSVQLLDLIDKTIENSLLLESKADESINLASIQAKSAKACLKNPCGDGQCIANFLEGSFSCRCPEGLTGKSFYFLLSNNLISIINKGRLCDEEQRITTTVMLKTKEDPCLSYPCGDGRCIANFQDGSFSCYIFINEPTDQPEATNRCSLLSGSLMNLHSSNDIKIALELSSYSEIWVN
jgi:hypothetical protein